VSDLDNAFPPGAERRVTSPTGMVALVVSDAPRTIDDYLTGNPVPAPVAMRCQDARGILRIAGSTAQAKKSEQERLLRFGQDMFGGGLMQNVVVMSGGTRVLNSDDPTVMMSILEFPSLIRDRWGSPTVRPIGSMPRTTQTMSYQGEHSTFVPGDTLDSRTLAHPGLDLLWIVQLGADQVAGWDGDLPAYFALMDLMYAEGLNTGLLVSGGGTVTAQEIRMAQEHGHPVGLMAGFGRFADDLINFDSGHGSRVTSQGARIINDWAAEGYDWRNYLVVDSPGEGREWLRAVGLMER
jgi:hypothetical protein